MNRLEELTDEELVAEYVNGSNKAFDILLARNQSKFFSYILFVVRDQDAANDIFQETFAKVIVKLQEGNYVPTGKFGAWLLRVTHNIIMDWYRNQRLDRIVEAPKDNDLSNIRGVDYLDSCIESQFVNAQILADVKKMMDKLPPTQREVVFMRFFQDLSFKDIAEATGVSINTALGRMRYAIMNLRRMAREHSIHLQLA